MEQINSLVRDLTIVQRASVVLAVLIAGGSIAALVHFRKESDFRPLYTAMAPEDAAPVVQKLKEAGVDYRLSDSGSDVSVPSSRLADSRLTLAAAGLPKSGRIGFELFDKTNFGATDLVEHINYQRALEGELERSIMSMREVVQARVHLSFPKESVFLDQQQPAKASVMIKLRPGARISAQNVLALSNLAASAVEGLNPDSVAVIDMDGNLLSRPKRSSTGDSQITSEALEVRQQIERDLVAKINTTLEPLLGADQFRAGASVECDLTSGEQEEESYNPDQSVMLSSQKSEDFNERNASGGIPGTAANLPHPAGATGGGSTSHRTENVTYQSSRVVRRTRIPQGVVRKMSLSVLVGQPTHWDGTGKNRRQIFTPPSSETMRTIRDLVAGVTGLDSSRGDQLIVETLPFESNIVPEAMQMLPPASSKPDAQPAWLALFEKYRNVVIAVVGGLMLLSILVGLVLRYMPRRNTAGSAVAAEQVDNELEAASVLRAAAQQAPPTAPPTAQETPALPAEPVPMLTEVPAETSDRIRQLAQKEPLATANVLRMWLQDQKL